MKATHDYLTRTCIVLAAFFQVNPDWLFTPDSHFPLDLQPQHPHGTAQGSDTRANPNPSKNPAEKPTPSLIQFKFVTPVILKRFLYV